MYRTLQTYRCLEIPNAQLADPTIDFWRPVSTVPVNFPYLRQSISHCPSRLCSNLVSLSHLRAFWIKLLTQTAPTWPPGHAEIVVFVRKWHRNRETVPLQLAKQNTGVPETTEKALQRWLRAFSSTTRFQVSLPVFFFAGMEDPGFQSSFSEVLGPIQFKLVRHWRCHWIHPSD